MKYIFAGLIFLVYGSNAFSHLSAKTMTKLEQALDNSRATIFDILLKKNSASITETELDILVRRAISQNKGDKLVALMQNKASLQTAMTYALQTLKPLSIKILEQTYSQPLKPLWPNILSDALFSASGAGNLEALQEIFRRAQFFPGSISKKAQQEALANAAREGQLGAVIYLVENHKTCASESSALQSAIYGYDKATVRKILFIIEYLVRKAKVDVNSPAESDQQPIVLAAHLEIRPVIELLLHLEAKQPTTEPHLTTVREFLAREEDDISDMDSSPDHDD